MGEMREGRDVKLVPRNGSLNTGPVMQIQTDCQTDRKLGMGNGWCQTKAGFGSKQPLMESGSGWGLPERSNVAFEWYAMLMCIFMGAGFVCAHVCVIYVCVCVCVCVCVQCRGMRSSVCFRERQTVGSHTSGPHACIHQSLGKG